MKAEEGAERRCVEGGIRVLCVWYCLFCSCFFRSFCFVLRFSKVRSLLKRRCPEKGEDITAAKGRAETATSNWSQIRRCHPARTPRERQTKPKKKKETKQQRKLTQKQVNLAAKPQVTRKVYSGKSTKKKKSCRREKSLTSAALSLCLDDCRPK